MSNIWHLLNIDSLAIDASFGLEYYIIRDMNKAKPLLEKGIQFCDMIQKGYVATTQETINSSDLDAWEDIQILVKYKSPEELKTIVEDAVSIKTDLIKIIQGNTVYSEEKIRKIQEFFMDTSKPYLRKAYNLMKRKEMCRRL
jgi:hypothetical protein